MKIFKFMAIALVAMLGFTACDKDCDHDYIEHDYSQALVGTWTCLDMDYAEALVINADGTLTATGVVDGEFFESKGTIQVKNNKMIYKLDNGDEWEGRFEMTTGESFTMVWDDEFDIRYTYRYCENDLADEVLGMWVCNDGPTAAKEDMMVQTFKEDGSSIMTGRADEVLVNDKSTTYKVVGDLIFLTMSKETVKHEAFRITYSHNGTAFGDIMTLTLCCNFDIAPTTTWLRIKQNLELSGKAYDYNNLYVTNVKGADKDIDFMGQSFNFSKMDGVKLDKMLKTLLFSVEFPNANTIKYSCHYNNQAGPAVVDVPIVVDGNKMTIKVSEEYPNFKDVDMYVFQDQDNCQMHMYMPTQSFEAFFGNIQVMALSQKGELDQTDAAAVKAVYDRVDAAVESINLSIILK